MQISDLPYVYIQAFIWIFSQTGSVVYYHHVSDNVIVTRYGKIRGVLVKFPSRHLQPAEAYFGLQYASTFGGDFRFLPPSSPTEKWQGIRVTLKPRPPCPQHNYSQEALNTEIPRAVAQHIRRINLFNREQLEECLHLNVFIPHRTWNQTKPIPVIVFIHGESYDMGTGNAYEGSVLASYGQVIVVTLNYRLGPLGFLSTGDSVANGNYALLDITAALHWLKENIASFNGDTNRITLFGHGHGAALVHLLTLSPISKGVSLFQRVIIHSGSALSSWAISVDPVECTRKLAINVNCSKFLDDSASLIKCLREKPYAELINNVPVSPKYYSCFAPTIDGRSVLPAPVEELLRRDDTVFSTLNVMMGLARNEGYPYLKQHEIDKGISADRKSQILRTFVQNLFKYHKQKVYEILQHHYTDWDKIADMRTRRDNVMELLSDGLYAAPLIKAALEHTKRTNTYLFNFGYTSQSEDYPAWADGIHGDDLPYIFGAPLVNGVKPFQSTYTNAEKTISKIMMRYWSNFAKTGNPNLPEQSTRDRGSENLDLMNWPTYEKMGQKYMFIGKRPTIRHHYRGDKLALWLDLLPKINVPDGADPSMHKLANSENISSFDDYSRLINHFVAEGGPFQPFQQITTTPNSNGIANDGALGNQQNKHSTKTVHFKNSSQTLTTASPPDGGMEGEGGEHGVNPAPNTSNDSSSESSVPLSFTIAIGCSLLLLNILILAAVCYQRQRIRKYKHTLSISEKPVEERVNLPEKTVPESLCLMSSNTTSSAITGKEPQMNGKCIKSLNQSPSTRTNYSYSALPTNPLSPTSRPTDKKNSKTKVRDLSNERKRKAPQEDSFQGKPVLYTQTSTDSNTVTIV